MEESIIFAKKYVEDLLSFFGLNTDVYATHDEEVIQVNIPSTHLNGFLIGQHGDTVRSIQYLVSMALKCSGHEVTRVSVDVADYKKHQQDRIAEEAQVWVKKVKESGKPLELKPMNPADRRVVHKVANDAGITTESVGEGRERHIILSPAKEQA